MLLINSFVFSLLLYLIRTMTLLYTSISFVLYIFISTFIITTIILYILKKLNYLNPFLSYLNIIIKYANMLIVIVTVIVLLFSYLNIQYNNMYIYCMPDGNDPFSIANIEVSLKNANIESWVEKIGGPAVFIAALKASSAILQKAPYPPMIKIGASSTGIYATYQAQNRMWRYSEVEKSNINAEDINVKVTLDDKNNPQVEAGKTASDASDSKLDINCPLEENEQQWSLLLEITEYSLYLTVVCAILNYFILIQSIFKYLADYNFDWVKNLPLPYSLGNKLYSIIIKILPFWKKSTSLIVIISLIVLLFFLIFDSYTLFFITTKLRNFK